MYFTHWWYVLLKSCSARALVVFLSGICFLCFHGVGNLCSATYAFFYGNQARTSRLPCVFHEVYLLSVFVDVVCSQDYISGQSGHFKEARFDYSLSQLNFKRYYSFRLQLSICCGPQASCLHRDGIYNPCTWQTFCFHQNLACSCVQDRRHCLPDPIKSY